MTPIKQENVQIRVCRVCLNSNLSVSVSLYADYWLNLYEYCFGLSIRTIDVSRKMCVLCAGEMIKFAKFKEQCLKSDKLWNDIMCRDLTCYLEDLGINKEHNEIAPKVEMLNDLKFEVDCMKELNEFDSKNSEGLYDFENGGFDIENDDFIIHCVDTKNHKRLEVIKANTDYNKNLFDSLTNDKNEIEFEDSKDENYIQDFEGCKDHSNLMSSPNVDIEALVKEYQREQTSHINLLQIRERTKKQRKKKSEKSTCKKKSDDIKKKRKRSKITKVNPVHECGLCETSFTIYKQLGQHLELHRTNLDMCCKQCGYSGRDFADLISHRFVHHSKEYRIILKCHRCNRICKRERVLQFHYRSVHMGQEGGLCIYCKKTFGNYKVWNNHERLHEIVRYICDHCGREFVSRHRIKDHMKFHSTEIIAVCDTCGRGFTHIRNWESHLKRGHDTQKVKCTHCNKFYKNKFNLHLHLRSLKKKKKAVCEICSKAFPNYTRLKRHMICMHSDERPFSCNICGKCYKLRDMLKIHMRTHTGDFPYKCNFCSRAFPYITQKKVHQSVHTGVRAHKCKYCDRSFHMKKLLAQHCSKKHGIELKAINDENKGIV